MPLFKCDKCGCIENTALGHYWSRGMKILVPELDDLALCSDCTSETYIDGTPYSKHGWHGKFPKVKATEKDKGTLINY